MLLRFFCSALVSDHWGNDDILTEISEFRDDIAKCAKDVIVMISSVVYPEIDGHNKQRLSYIYGILSACYLRLRKTDEQALVALVHQYHQHKKHNLEPFQFYKVLEQECHRVSVITNLDFKNIAGLDDLNFGCINEEISINIHESTVETLADMVRALGSIYGDSEATACIMSWQSVYKHHIQGCLACLENEIKSCGVNPDELQEMVGKIELSYDDCRKYVRSLAETERSYIIGRYCMLCIPHSSPSWKPLDESAWKNCLTVVLSFWIKMTDEGLDTKHLARCLKILKELLIEGEISTDCGWNTISVYTKLGLKGGLTADISSFFQAMIFSGCGFKIIAKVYSEAELYSTSLSLDGKLNNLVDVYIYLMEKSLFDLSRGCEERQDLHNLLSSLSRLEGGDSAEDLNTIRCRVWRKLTAFSGDMQLDSHLRVYALELMQAIAGQNRASLPHDLALAVHPWEGWEQECFATRSPTAERVDASASSITNTLIALKSTRLVALISPNIKITPEDLVTLESAISCFLRLSEMATSLPDLSVLQSVLEEWEVLFSSTGVEVNKETGVTVESPVEESNNWSSDEWDNEGWETLPEEELGKTEQNSKDDSYSIRILHSCWMEIIRKLIRLSEFNLVIEMLDRSFSKSKGVEVLLDEDEAQCLYELVVQIDCFLALKMLLLLPYKGPRSQCLHAVEASLKDFGGSPSGAPLSVDNGYELLILVLSSGVLKDVAADPTFGKVFSYLCHLVGYLARLCQEGLLERRRDNNKGTLDQTAMPLFCTVLLPCFLSQLVEAGQCLLAGFIVSQWMHTHSSLGLIDVVEASLRRYLEGQFLATGQLPGSESADQELVPCGSLVYSLSGLRGKVGSMLQSAILALPSDTRR